MQEAADFIAKIGFPVFVSVWLMVRTDKYVKEMTAALQELTLLLRANRAEDKK